MPLVTILTTLAGISLEILLQWRYEKQPLTPHLAEFNIEDESSGEDNSDEDWGKNVNNVVGVDENESFEEEESVERKRKRNIQAHDSIYR